MLGKGIGLLALLIIVASITPAFALTELERASIDNPKVTNAFGVPIGNKINVDQQIQIAADITNNQEKSQTFYYLVQIKNSEGFTMKVDWFSGKLNPHQKWNTSVFWVPQDAGEFTAEIFVWEGFPVNHKALAEYSTIQISVS
ncbi:hypothetical protein [Candidatus Nitrosopumilus sediminis]|uniref:DUF1616 domain-containing protein n=1 Tax=Candidatus Nitrosopumilus sediminis TaxID=1229909 RepID=K0B8Q6_9ARCH|nr:hypothetical protein [Candidatus Nitrosopumilus sediminis]AFS82563.1 hypothetical protein NSED_03785 [Candidatus Nitrosopumilus sediminis]